VESLKLILFLACAVLHPYAEKVKQPGFFCIKTNKKFKQLAKFTPILEITFDYEGGYQNYPTDKANYSGGKLVGTNHGISAMALEAYLGHTVTVNDILAVDKRKARQVYKELFWDKVRGDDIKDQGVAHIVFDSYIANPSTSKRMVQSTLDRLNKNTYVSIPFSEDVVKKINNTRPSLFFDTFYDERKKELSRLAPSYPQFITGWTRRVDEIYDMYYKNGIYQKSSGFVKKAIIALIIISVFGLGYFYYKSGRLPSKNDFKHLFPIRKLSYA
jgi:lysozyme family protein